VGVDVAPQRNQVIGLEARSIRHAPIVPPRESSRAQAPRWLALG